MCEESFNRNEVVDLPDTSHSFEAKVKDTTCKPGAFMDVDATPTLNVELLPPKEALKFDLHPVAYVGESGKAPRINAEGYWEVYDNETKTWIDTNVYAKGLNDYNDFANKPRINDVELSGNKTAEDLGLEKCIENQDIEAQFEEE